jgi:hypothetical protein
MDDSSTISLGLSTIKSSIDSLRFQSIEDLQSLKTIIDKNSSENNLITGVSNDTCFTVFTTLFVFFIGITINQVIKIIEKQFAKKKLRGYFKYHIDKINTIYSGRLINEYKDFYQKISIDFGIPMTPPKIFSGDFDRIKNIDSKELFHSVKEKKELSNILNQISYFENVIKEVDNFHKISLKESDALRIKIYEQSNQYLSYLTEFTEFERNNNPQFVNDPHFIHFNHSIIYFYEQIAGKRALKKFYQKVVRNNQEYIVANQLFRSHPKGKSIADLGKDISYEFNNLKRLTTEYKIQFRIFVTYLNESKNILNESIGKINWRLLKYSDEE